MNTNSEKIALLQHTVAVLRTLVSDAESLAKDETTSEAFQKCVEDMELPFAAMLHAADLVPILNAGEGAESGSQPTSAPKPVTVATVPQLIVPQPYHPRLAAYQAVN